MALVSYVEGDESLLARVQPLWEGLNRHHLERSPYFGEWYAGFTFERRREMMLQDCRALQVILALDGAEAVGYCISKVAADGMGEIESLYVTPACRGQAVGDGLMRRALAWLDAQGVKGKRLGVAVGNEDVFAFYRRYGFYPRLTVLLQKVDN